ncbi:hypothetical protein FHN55_16625 [Streptomyces sp. NP160]|uniref:hypothetical protein n=1 Tax=Streptomyces sp. NP160 TaxID=2586637 RepID=UPI001117D232|nr:hypothetical protein [Streptomyces sp. NP160]TNM61938.1 hypothetical protein FHN55_16625 [Streptomyces sp. NP160]
MSSPRPRGAPSTLIVEVDYIEPGRWIVAIDAPGGSFSTETNAASKVEAAARAAIAEVLRVVDVELVFVGFDGRPWSPSATD